MASIALQVLGKGKFFKGSATITIAATAAAGEEDIEITDANAEVNDVVSGSLLAADMETGVCVCGLWVSEAGKIKIRISNVNAANALNGGSATLNYTLVGA